MDIGQPQTRTVDGRQEIYDNILQDWRGVTPLDRVKPTIDPNRRFVCPNCLSEVDVHRITRGWDIHQIDPNDGEIVDLIEEEITDADVEKYQCGERCGWEGDYKWFRRMQDGGQEEEKAPIQLTLLEEAPTQIPDTEPTAFHRYIWRNTTPDPF